METPGSAVHSFLGSDRALCFPNTKQGWVPVRRRAGRCCNGTRREGEVLLHPRFPQSSGERMAWLGINFLPDRVLPLSYFAVISFGLVTLHSFSLQAEKTGRLMCSGSPQRRNPLAGY